MWKVCLLLNKTMSTATDQKCTTLIIHTVTLVKTLQKVKLYFKIETHVISYIDSSWRLDGVSLCLLYIHHGLMLLVGYLG